MKRSTKILLIIAAVLVAVGALMFTVALVKVGFDFGGFTKMNTKSYDITDDFDRIFIDSETADIYIEVWDGDKVKVECTESEKISYDISVSDSTLKIEVEDNRRWYDYIGFYFGNSHIRVYLPASTVLSSLAVDNTTGDIRSNAKITENVNLKTTTGDIELKNTDCSGSVEVRVTTGDLIMTDAFCRDLVCGGTTGDIKLKNVVAEEKIELKRTTGDITFERIDAGDIDINTTTGSIRGSLLTGKDFSAKATTGSVSIPQSTGGGKCKLKATTGDIKVEIVP